VDDIMKEEYPVHPYHRRTFKARCIDREGKERTVETYSHPLYMTDYDMHKFVQRHIDRSICSDHLIEGREFFTARMKPLYERAVELAKRNITIYPRSSYRLAYMFRRG
jgi:hypothetical protein